MKVKYTIEFEVEPVAGRELSAKEHSNIVGMLQRIMRNRLMGFVNQQVGAEHVPTGWEVTVKDIDISAVTKT